MNRTQYLLARLQWKSDYAAAQQRIRSCKVAIREAHRALSRCGLYKYPPKAEDREHNRQWSLAYDEVFDKIRDLHDARKAMEDHLKALWRLKELARQAWLKQQSLQEA